LDAYHLRNFCLLALFWATLRCCRIGPAGSEWLRSAALPPGGGFPLDIGSRDELRRQH
jgi:hypothetical protein